MGIDGCPVLPSKSVVIECYSRVEFQISKVDATRERGRVMNPADKTFSSAAEQSRITKG